MTRFFPTTTVMLGGAPNDLDQVLEAGTLLVIRTGDYCDREWGGPVRVVRTVTKRHLAERFLASWKPSEPQLPGHRLQVPDSDEFLPWLLKEGHVEDPGTCVLWHVGDGDFEP